jgi:hypothetical protein
MDKYPLYWSIYLFIKYDIFFVIATFNMGWNNYIVKPYRTIVQPLDLSIGG